MLERVTSRAWVCWAALVAACAGGSPAASQPTAPQPTVVAVPSADPAAEEPEPADDEEPDAAREPAPEPLSPMQKVAVAVQARSREVTACYQRAQKSERGLRAEIVIEASVEAGRVNAARVARPGAHPALEACVLKLFSSLSLPDFGKPLSVRYPFHFAPGGDQAVGP